MIRPPLSLDKNASQRHYWAEHHLFRNEKTPVAIRREHQTNTAPHRHEFAEFALILSGTGIHETGTLRYDLVPGEIFLIADHRAHAYHEVKNLEILNILIRHQTLESLEPVVQNLAGYTKLFGHKGRPFKPLQPLLPESLDKLTRIVSRMETELEHLDSGSPAMLTAMLTELLLTACRLVDTTSSENTYRSSVGKLISHLEQHLEEPLTLNQMESIAGMSTRTLQRQFKLVTRSTPLQYLLRLRLASACRFLRETNLPAQEIAGLCGIPDPAYFSRIFHQTIGQSPRAYRQKILNV